MPRPISPVIVIPGITASDLYDQYELPPEAVWTTMRKRRYERIALHPADTRYELREPARVTPDGPFPLVYGGLVEELRDGLSEGRPDPVPVFPFGYDWRMPLDRTEAQLADFVQQVIGRTLLLPGYRGNEAYAANPTVSLIGHSMGGLIVAGYLKRNSAVSVDKVVTLATPFQGSFEAILKVTTGTADLGYDFGKARERRAARMTPALYHLLPAFEGSLTVDEGLEDDIFRPETWQPSVVRTIEAQVRDWDVSGSELFAQMLDRAKAHRDRISALELQESAQADSATDPVTAAGHPAAALRKDDWLAIAGVGARTRVALRVRRDDQGAPRFDLRSHERRNDWDSDDQTARRNTGDGTVPLEGAIPPFLGESRLVCVTRGDFGYWELRDRTLARFTGLHGLLPTMNMVHRLILRFILGRDDRYGNTWGRRSPGVAKGEWRPPLALAEKN